MNVNERDLETLLRRAPVPCAPADLADRLIREIQLPDQGDRRHHRTLAVRPGVSRWRWWIPLLLPAAAAVGLSTTAIVRNGQIREMQVAVERLARDAELEPGRALRVAELTGVEAPADERAEIARLRGVVERLREELAILEGGDSERQELRAAIATLQEQLGPELREMLLLQQEGKDRAKRIRCVNHMKQLGLAVRVWANDNDDQFPPNIHSMSNELATPKILICPSDPGRVAAESWESLSAAGISYEYLAPGPGAHGIDPLRVMWRCPFHGNVTLCDGAVQMGVGLEHPERLSWRNGALYYGEAAATAAAAGGQGGPGIGESSPANTSGGGGGVEGPPTPGSSAVKVLQKRYGLTEGLVAEETKVLALPVIRDGQVIGWVTNTQAPPGGSAPTLFVPTPEMLERWGLNALPAAGDGTSSAGSGADGEVDLGVDAATESEPEPEL